MAVQRNSEAAQFGGGQAVQQQQSGAGTAGVDANKYGHSTYIKASSPDSSASRVLDSIVGAIAPVAQQYANKWMVTHREEAYLAGQAAATTGKAEEDLQSDIFTKDWATAGYRDTMGRLSLADNASRIQEDMTSLREKPPEEFSEYMTQRRKELLPSLEGMSLEARKAVFSTMALNENAVFKQHAGEHRKFVWEQQQASIHSQIGTSLSLLDKSAKIESAGADSTSAYKAATNATLGNIHQLVVMNPNVPIAARSNMLYEAARDALATNHQQLYTMIRDTQLPMPDGSMGTMMNMMNSIDRSKLDGAYRESMARTAGARSANTLLQLGKWEAEWEDKDSPVQPAEEVKEFLTNSFHSGYFGDTEDPKQGAAEKMAAYWHKYNKSLLSKTGKTQAGSAWFTGDVARMVSMGKTRKEAMQDWQDGVGSKLPLSENVSKLIQSGLSNGQYEGLELAGTIMQPAFARLAVNESIDPDSATLVSNTLQALDKLGNDHPAAMHTFLQSHDPDTQEFILQIQSNLRSGFSSSDAVRKAQAFKMENSKVDRNTRVAMMGKTNQENADLLANMDTKGPLGALWQNAKGLVSGGAANKANIMVKEGYFENPERAAEAQYIVKSAKAEELQRVSRDHPFASAEVRDKLSDAAVAGRVVQTAWGPLAVPAGQTFQSYFGVKDGERIGQTLSTMLKPQNPNHRVVFQTGANGELLYQEVNEYGVKAKMSQLNPKTVAAAVEAARNEEVRKIGIRQGQGTTTKVNGIELNYNGNNTAGVDPEWMYNFRKRLIEHEGVTDTPKDDIGGRMNKRTGKVVQTGGVGLSDTSTHYKAPAGPNGTLTPQQINNGLRDSSEEAAKIAQGWMVAAKTPGNEKAFQLFSELAYQGGGWNKATNPIIVAFQNRDYKAAQTALLAHPAYKMAGDGARRKFYLDTLQQALK